MSSALASLKFCDMINEFFIFVICAVRGIRINTVLRVQSLDSIRRVHLHAHTCAHISPDPLRPDYAETVTHTTILIGLDP